MLFGNRTPWLPIAIAVAFCLVGIFGVVTVVNTQQIREGERHIADAYAIREAAHQLLSAMKDSETGQRGFVLTGDEDHLVTHGIGTDDARALFIELNALAVHHPEIADSLQKLGVAFEKQQAHFARIITLRRRQAEGHIGDEVLGLVRLGGGKASMDSARLAVDGIVEKQSEKLNRIEANTRYLDRLTQSTITAGHLIALASILCIGLAAFADRRNDARYGELISAAERRIFTEVLRYTDGNLTQAAKRLGITRTTLRTRLDHLGISLELTISAEKN